MQRKHDRLKYYDYSQGGYYFVTICVNERKDIFGIIANSKFKLNECGNIVENIPKEIPARYKYVEIDSYVIMPDHLHIIIIIDPSESKDQKVKSLSEIVGAFKTLSSKAIHQKGLVEFKWQRSFYDRIIRNEQELFFIRKYIEENPLRKEIELEFPDNLEM